MSCRNEIDARRKTREALVLPAARKHGDGEQLRVLAFLCNWCSYAGADKAGAQELPVPPELSVVRVMCSGRVEPTLVLEAFAQGADGVIVLACHPGDCHYKEGNSRARVRAELLGRLVAQLGIDARRFHFDYVSAAEADKFSELTCNFVERIRAISSTSTLRENSHDNAPA